MAATATPVAAEPAETSASPAALGVGALARPGASLKEMEDEADVVADAQQPPAVDGPSREGGEGGGSRATADSELARVHGDKNTRGGASDVAGKSASLRAMLDASFGGASAGEAAVSDEHGAADGLVADDELASGPGSALPVSAAGLGRASAAGSGGGDYENEWNITALPFEFDVLEGMLIFECMRLSERFLRLEPALADVARKLPENASQRNLETMLRLHTELVAFEDDTRMLHGALTSLLDSDEDMSSMYLTHRATTGFRRPLHAHDELEMLLESYAKHVDDLLSRTRLLNKNVGHSEKLAAINLDCVRNRIMQTK